MKRFLPWAGAAALGAAAALALPPVHALPVLLISFPGLLWLAGKASRSRGVFAIGWWWGFGHFSAGLYWIANALLVDPARFGWLIPFAVFGLAGVLAFFPAFAVLLACRAAPPGILRLLALAGGWALFEWVRSWLFTGFPWNLIATVWLPVLPVSQLAALVGPYGLGILTVAAAASPALLGLMGRRDIRAFAGIWLVVAIAAAWGAARIPEGPSPVAPGIVLRLVQGNIPQTLKWDPALRPRHLMDYVSLSTRPGLDGIRAVIWPETAVPYLIESDDAARAAVAEAAPPGGLVITGTTRARPIGQPPRQIWNSLVAVTTMGDIVAVYDKAHLVPFGEYVPFRGVIPLEKITVGALDFTPGEGLQTLDLPGLPPVSPTICYEDIFPGWVAPSSPRPSWLLNVTNDGWFGNSAGPYQHFAAARMRAIEEGLPMVRAANTGISGVIDPYGRVVGQIGLGERGVLDENLPLSLEKPPLFARYGDILFAISLSLITLVVFLGRCALNRGRVS
ncbi:MAG: apolipoprotein N-acyltransferase [Rhodospirillaceae bacterium]|nr:apolipoprotein N-acyltransferase [Rhodospirillaceae bacterium]